VCPQFFNLFLSSSTCCIKCRSLSLRATEKVPRHRRSVQPSLRIRFKTIQIHLHPRWYWPRGLCIQSSHYHLWYLPCRFYIFNQVNKFLAVHFSFFHFSFLVLNWIPHCSPTSRPHQLLPKVQNKLHQSLKPETSTYSHFLINNLISSGKFNPHPVM
jgi:hypothetical protein